MITKFNEVKLYSVKNCKCSECGKRLRRQKKFYQTLNPWNVNANGECKTRQEIIDELKEKVVSWESESELCANCEEQRG